MNQFVETIKIKEGKAMALPYHQARMERTIRHFFPSLNATTMPCLEEIITPREELINPREELIIPRVNIKLFKCRVVYGEQGVEAVEYTPYTMRTIRTLKIIEANDIDYSYKSTDRTELNRLTAQKGDCDDIVIVKNGLITDTSFTNLAIFDGHHWLTPAHPLLAGTKRAFLLDQGTIIEKDLTPDDLMKADKIRLFNAMIDFGEIEVKVRKE